MIRIGGNAYAMPNNQDVRIHYEIAGGEGAMKTFIRNGMIVLIALTGLIAFGSTAGWGQEKHKISFKSLAANTKYTQQHAIDVGDMPGHQVRVYELHRTFPTNPPMFEGVKVVESWTRGLTDYVDLNGRVSGYTVWVLENGDKIFSQLDGTSQTTVNPDGSKRSVASTVLRLTGGTGKFLKIQGLLRQTSIFDPVAGLNEQQGEGEYWMEK
jgi:hypothetical protein